MSMNIAVTALNSSQAALQVIGHNIANVNTAGYSRQSVSLEQIPGQKFGNGFFGKGVEIAAVERAYSQFLTREANLSAATASSATARYQRLQTLEQLFPMGEAGLGQQLNGFLNAWADVVASPTNQTARGVVLTRAEEFSSRLNQTAGQLEELKVTTRVQIEAAIDQANRLAQGLAQLNQRVVDAYASGKAPNDLLDQRDQLVAELNKVVQVNTLEADDHSLTVFVANSVPVVLGRNATALVGSESVDPAGRYTLGFGAAQGVLNEDLLGGELRGLLGFYNDDVADVSNQLGRLALATVELTNRQHRSGLDLNGQPGQDVYRAITFDTAISQISGNTASLSLGVDPGAGAATQFQASDYAVRYTAANTVELRRTSDGLYFNQATSAFDSSTPLTATFSAPSNALVFDGLRLTQATSGAVGDQLLVRPFADVAEQLKVALTSPSQLAISSPVYVQAGADNADTLQVQSALRPSGAATVDNWSHSAVRFTSPGTYVIDTYKLNPANPALAPTATTSAAQNFTSGVPILVDGTELTLRGAPTNGDVFEVRSASRAYLTTDAANTGTLSVQRFHAWAAPAANIQIAFPSATTYTLNGGPPQAFVPGQPIRGNGFELVLDGVPAAGDDFTVLSTPTRAAVDMRQNAGNGQALLALRDLDALDGYTLSDGYIPVFSAVSSSIQVAKAEAEFSTRVAEQAEASRANQSGVNLDEEAARLLQFQQAYQAAAKYLQSIQSVFDTLLSTFGR